MFIESQKTKNNERKSSGKFTPNYGDDEEDYIQGDYLDIWERNPSYRDVNANLLNGKMIVIVILNFIVFITLLFKFSDVSLAISITLFLWSGFFIDKIMDFPQKLRNAFRSAKIVNPFESIEFYSWNNFPETLFIYNKQLSLSIALRIYKIEILPENVQPTLNQFLKALMDSNIKFSYHVLQKPSINVEYIKQKLKNSTEQKLNSFSQQHSNYPSETSIYFTVSHHLKGPLGRRVLEELIEKVSLYSQEIKSIFTANFHHTKVKLLESDALYNAVRVLSFADSPNIPSFRDKEHPTKRIDLRVILKVSTMIMTIVLIWFLFFSLDIIALLLPFITGGFLYFFVFVWWRDLLFFFSLRLFTSYEGFSCIDLFYDTKFFQHRGYKDILFANIQNLLLVGLKMHNLAYCYKLAFAYPDKFFRAINEQEIYYNYTVNAESYTATMRTGEWETYLNEKTREALEGILIVYLDKKVKKVKYPRAELDRWLQMRAGIWKTFLMITTTCVREITSHETLDFEGLIQEVNNKAIITKKAFENNFLKLRLIPANSKVLMNGFVSTCMNSVDFNDQNTYLPYLYIQGKRLMNLIAISNEYKKGVETQIAAEFNTPLSLRNFVTIGSTINTEFLQEEKPLGFTLEQYKNLLITNGVGVQREYTRMKIAIELIQQQVPCIIFDFNGVWSIILHVIEQSQQEMDILFFKLGKNLTINLSKSGMEPDPNNIEYLSYFYDTFALAFKEQKSTIDSLKESVSRDEKIDLTSINLELTMKKALKKPIQAQSNRLSNLLNDFIENVAVFSPDLVSSDNSNTPIGFVTNDKSIILDLSILRNLDQKVFIAFSVLSQMVHYLNNSINYVKKVIFMPNIDLFFDSQYIDNNYTPVNYGTINKFLDPLVKHGFGLIFSANQIHYLHPNVLNYFSNILTYKALDKRDIAVLQDKMNLQELHGTGYYSSKRNNTYQIDYLKNMNIYECLIKRSDIPQPFPGRVDYEPLLEFDVVSYEAILDYMTKKGYNLRQTERYIVEQTAKTLFEKDFGVYSTYIEEIINFLNAVNTIDEIGNLYKNKLKKELINYIYPKSKKRNYNKVQLKALSDELFAILVNHGYLVESHPNTAAGSESIRTSYQVGLKFTQALDDYYNSRNTIIEEPLEIIEGELSDETEHATEIEPEKDYEVLNKEIIEPLLKSNIGSLFLDSFYIDRFINRGDYNSALERGEKVILDFFSELFSEYLNKLGTGVFNVENLRQFIKQLSVEGYIPYFDSEIEELVRTTHELATTKTNHEQNAKKMFEIIMSFYDRLNSIKKEEE